MKKHGSRYTGKILAFVLCFIFVLASALPAFAGYTDYPDEDGDGLVLVTVPGETFTAYIMIVLDPTRVIVGCRPEYMGSQGFELSEYVDYFDAVAGINAGGFSDPNGEGDGSVPEHLIVHNGEMICGGLGVGNCFTGFDADGILQTDFPSAGSVTERGILEGAGFGPVLVRNGEASEESKKDTGLNPRTVIGQRADGAVLMLVIDGRQPNSLGGNYTDAAELMLQFGAVTAVNMDGGNSSLMWYDGDYINNKSHSTGVRNMPSTFLVLKEGRSNWPTETFKERFGDYENVTGKSESIEISVPNDMTVAMTGAAVKTVSDEIQEELFAFSADFVQKYVDYSADIHHECITNFGKLSQFVVKDSELYNRFHSAYSSFGFSQTKACNVVEFDMTACSETGENSYTVELSYTTDTTGVEYEKALETRSMRLGMIRGVDGKLYVDTMTFI